MDSFQVSKLLEWFSHAQRKLPWRENYSPYEVWLSEVMAQQTRIEQMLPYYARFLKKFPTVKVLADADEEKVLKEWEGLGYYSRARNVQAAAKQIVNEKSGKIPTTKEELGTLRGFGPYISSAVASIAFNQDEVVVDGNVFRVMSRFWGNKEDVSLPKTRRLFEKKLLKILPRGKARDFNQALMELGALVCVPEKPLCEKCPLSKACFANIESKQSFFPVKKKKGKIPLRHFAAIHVENDARILLFPRKEKLLNGMYEFPMVEYNPLSDSVKDIEKKIGEKFGWRVHLSKKIGDATQQYSHFKQHVCLFDAVIEKKDSIPWVRKESVSSLPLSRIQQKLLRDF
ncbi:MAG: A/G-specific adenine glycosylase [Candidatus Diapherotrites archaeon]